MKPRCPACGAVLDPETAWREGLWWEALGLLARFGPAGKLVLEYIDLFRLPARGMTLERRVRILKELLPLWEAGKYTKQGYTYRAEKPQIVEALQDVLGAKNLKPPLKNHNYLKECLHPLAQKTEAERERTREERRRAGIRDDDRPERRRPPLKPPVVPRVETPEVSEEVKALLAQGKTWEASQLMAKERREKDEALRGPDKS